MAFLAATRKSFTISGISSVSSLGGGPSNPTTCIVNNLGTNENGTMTTGLLNEPKMKQPAAGVAPCVPKLAEEEGALGVHRIHDGLPCLHLVVAPEPGHTRVPRRRLRHSAGLGDEADARPPAAGSRGRCAAAPGSPTTCSASPAQEQPCDHQHHTHKEN